MLKVSISNKNFILLLLIFAALDGVYIGIGVVLDPFFGSIGFNASQVSFYGGLFVVCGVISSLIVGFLLDRY